MDAEKKLEDYHFGLQIALSNDIIADPLRCTGYSKKVDP